MLKSASAEEAAAVAAAIERFVAEAARAAPPPAVSPWQRAALIEGVGARDAAQDLRRFD